MRPVLIYRECPKCKGRLSLRTQRATGNAFLGCTNYPDCRFTENISVTTQQLASRITALEDELFLLRGEVQRLRSDKRQAINASTEDMSRFAFLDMGEAPQVAPVVTEMPQLDLELDELQREPPRESKGKQSKKSKPEEAMSLFDMLPPEALK